MMDGGATENNRITFIRESNRIEGIVREPNAAEIAEMFRFVKLDAVTVDDLIKFVGVYQPDAMLRISPAMNVRVGNHIAPQGGIHIQTALEALLNDAAAGADPYHIHCRYETLHPFTDGNGRSGRALWAWQMVNQDIRPGLRLGFLHAFYYQTLANCSGRVAPDFARPLFDCIEPEQEELVIKFCEEIAGKKGEPGSPPDPVRLLEMAEALYLAEVRGRAAPTPA